jgi:hypothetical protein
MAVKTLLALVVACGVALAQPADRLRDGNAAAAAGDWARVTAIVEPLLRGQLSQADLAEAHRLAGLAAYFQRQLPTAETHFVAYLKLDLDGRLDPSVYPPDAVTFFQDVQMRHAAELRARRPKQRRFWLLNLIPPGGQIQNGESKKAVVVASLLGVLAIAHVSSWFILDSWCTKVSGSSGSSVTCDEPRDRASTAASLKTLNTFTGVLWIATYVYGVYDGVSGFRKRSREQQMFVMPTSGGGVVGIGGSF